MRLSPSIIPASTRVININSWKSTWYSSKENYTVLDQEDKYFRKWISNFFYKKQKKIFFQIAASEKKKIGYSTLQISKRNTFHFTNILRVRKHVASKAMNWVVHNVNIVRSVAKMQLDIYISCWMHSTGWIKARQLCTKWFNSQNINRLSILNNKLFCNIIWVNPVNKSHTMNATDKMFNALKKQYLLKEVLESSLILRDIKKERIVKNNLFYSKEEVNVKTNYQFLYNDSISI